MKAIAAHMSYLPCSIAQWAAVRGGMDGTDTTTEPSQPPTAIHLPASPSAAVNIPDSNLRTALETATGKTSGQTIT